MRSTTRFLPALGLLCAALPDPARAQLSVPGNAACSLLAGSRKEGMINPAAGEDEAFFGSKSPGQPSVALVLDTSENMRRLILDVTDPGVVGAALLPGNPPGPTARGCSNTQLDALVYAANPCRDD